MLTTTEFELQEVKINNPYPGLRPFEADESHLYFGRDEQKKEVADKLIQNRFVSIIGTSGIGKSSFIRCGVFPELHKRHDAGESNAWEIIAFRPTESPLHSLVNACNEALGQLQDNPTLLTVDAIKEDSQLIIDLVNRSNQKKPANYLFFIDQFEELFRFQEVGEQNSKFYNSQESEHFVEKFLHLLQNTELPIYVVITMRSDFLGNCSQYPELTRRINSSQFLIPYMTESEKREAIVKPIEISGGTMEENLVRKILEDVGNNPDQLPTMQHALMRTWQKWQDSRLSNSPMGLSHYTQTGGITLALSNHANEAYNQLNDAQKRSCARIFKSITETNTEGKRIRRPKNIAELSEIVNINEQEIIQIINVFLREDRKFLTASREPLDSNSVVDISHESLIRNWDTLKEWMNEEEDSVKTYKKLTEDAKKQQGSRDNFLTSPTLDTMVAWREAQKPTPAWGNLYDKEPSFERTMRYLKDSENDDKKKKANAEIVRKIRRRNSRIFLMILLLGAVVAGIFGFYAYLQSIEADKQSKIAEKNAKDALAKEKIAIQKSKEASEQAEKARIAGVAAKKSAEIAENEKIIALAAKENALRQEKVAQQQKLLALAAEKDARAATERAKIEARIAKINEELADIEKAKAYNLRLLSIAGAMAIKSKQLGDSIQQKALVAKQAFIFHQRSGGNENDPYLYEGLYYALKGLYGDDFNKLKGHQANVRAIAQGSGNQIFSAGSDGRIIKWDSQNRNLLSSRFDSAKVGYRINRAVAYSNSGQLACAGNFSYIQIIDANDVSKEVRRLPIKGSQVWFLEFAANNQLISVDDNGNMSIWDLNTENKEPKETKNLVGKVEAVAVEGNLIAYSKGTQINLINISQGLSAETPFHTDSYGQSVQALAFSHDGKRLAYGNANGLVEVYQVNSKTRIASPLKGHKNARVNSMCFSKDGSQLATASFDQTVRIWNVKTGRTDAETDKNYDDPPIVLDDHKQWVWSIQFSPDGKNLMAGCKDNLIRSWPTNVKDMADKICPQLQRNMSEKEWERFVAPISEVNYEYTCEGKPKGK